MQTNNEMTLESALKGLNLLKSERDYIANSDDITFIKYILTLNYMFCSEVGKIGRNHLEDLLIVLLSIKGNTYDTSLHYIREKPKKDLVYLEEIATMVLKNDPDFKLVIKLNELSSQLQKSWSIYPDYFYDDNTRGIVCHFHICLEGTPQSYDLIYIIAFFPLRFFNFFFNFAFIDKIIDQIIRYFKQKDYIQYVRESVQDTRNRVLKYLDSFIEEVDQIAKKHQQNSI